MGVEYSGQLCVGYDYEEIKQVIEKTNFDDEVDTDDIQSVIELMGLESYAPYFDAPLNNCIFGYSLAYSPSYSASKVSVDMLQRAQVWIDTFKLEYGITPAIYIMAEGY